MSEIGTARVWNPLEYLSTTELSRLDEQYNIALRDAAYLVFWTGVERVLVQRWAEQNGLETLISAMGPLFDPSDPTSARRGKSPKRWSRYMRGASGRFAEYACQGRRAIVFTNPPPNIYSTRKQSTYRHLEEPLLRGVFGGCSVVSIEYVHPIVEDTACFRYQVWPVDKSCEWFARFNTFLPKQIGNWPVESKSMLGEQIMDNDEIQEEVAKQTKERNKPHEEQTRVHEKKEARRKKMEEEQKRAHEKKQSRRKKVEEEQTTAEEKKQAKREKVEEGQMKAEEKKQAKRKKVIEEQKRAKCDSKVAR